MNPITILIAEDHAEMRAGLLTLLAGEPDFEVVGQAENGRQAVAFASKYCPDIVMMDITMPLIDGLEATRHILETTPSTKVLVLSSHNDEAYVSKAKDIGAAGYLVKLADAKRIPEAIRSVHIGGSFIYPTKSIQTTPIPWADFSEAGAHASLCKSTAMRTAFAEPELEVIFRAELEPLIFQ